MRKNGLTISMIFEAQSANYGEGMGNIATLKHLTRADGEQYTYISRQALRYSMIEQLGWANTPVEANGSGTKKVIQFKPGTTIQEYPEIDLFGYMKTSKGGATTRSAVVRLSNAVSLEPFYADLDFLTNMGLAQRKGEMNSIAQSELHKSFYTYTITVDLDRVGIDENDGINLDVCEKASRVCRFLDCIEQLYRDIKGRRENLSPVFVVGGVYDRKTPFFENRICLHKNKLLVQRIVESMETMREDTEVGYLPGTFTNDKEIEAQLQPVSIATFFQNLKKKVEDAYAGC